MQFRVFSRDCSNYTLGRTARMSRKGWVTQLLPMKRLPFGCIFAQGCKMQVTGTEKGTNAVFLHTTVDDGDHFQQILAWTLKSRRQNRTNSCVKSPEFPESK